MTGRTLRIVSVSLLAALLACAAARAAEGDAPAAPKPAPKPAAKAPAKPPAPWPPKLSDEALKKIGDACPAEAAKPAKARKVLVFTLTPGFKHTVIPATSAAIEAMGKKSGAWETVVSDDMAMFEADKLAQFDAVILNNTCGVGTVGRELFLPADLEKLPAEKKQEVLDRDARLKKNFAEFVTSGKGLVGLHGATGAFHRWPEFGPMLGGLFVKHPWTQKVRVKVDDPASPICAAFEGKAFEIKEETYEVGKPYSRETLRVLLTLDVESVDARKGSRTDGDYALAWIKTCGKGRVFYSAFSHFDENWMSPAMLKFHLAGIQYALGDLPADATPSAQRGK